MTSVSSTPAPDREVATRRLGLLGVFRRPVVFISSTSEDLYAHREAVADALQGMGFSILAMEDFPAMPSGARAGSEMMVQRADLLVGIYARRYGTVDPIDKRSITELEYRAARAANLPVLAFMLDEGVPWSDALTDKSVAAEQLRRFTEAVRSQVIVDTFADERTLVQAVRKAAREFLQLDRRRRARRVIAGVAAAGMLVAAAHGYTAQPHFQLARTESMVLAPLIARGPPPTTVGGIVVHHSDRQPTALTLANRCQLPILGTQKGTLFVDGQLPIIRDAPHPAPIVSLSTSDAHSCVLSVRASDPPNPSRLQCWDTSTFKLRWQKLAETVDDDFTFAEWSRHGEYLWLGDTAGRITMLSPSGEMLWSGQLPNAPRTEGEWIRGVAERGDGAQLLVSRNMAGHYRVELASPKDQIPQVQSLPKAREFIYADQAVFTDSGAVVAGLRMGKNPSRSRLQRYDLGTSKIETFGNHESVWHRVWALEGEYILALLSHGQAEIWHTAAVPPNRVAIVEPELGGDLTPSQRRVGGATLCDNETMALVIGGKLFFYQIQWQGIGEFPVPRILRRWFQ